MSITLKQLAAHNRKVAARLKVPKIELKRWHGGEVTDEHRESEYIARQLWQEYKPSLATCWGEYIGHQHATLIAKVIPSTTRPGGLTIRGNDGHTSTFHKHLKQTFRDGDELVVLRAEDYVKLVRAVKPRKGGKK